MLFSASIFVLIIYISLENVTQTITVTSPSIDQFHILDQHYPNTRQCPCDKSISIQYQNFISFQPQLHQICSSDFLSSKIWLEIDYPVSLFNANGRPTFRTAANDFRQIASSFFQLLSSLCQLSLQTINTELLTFNSTSFITPNLITKMQFQLQTNQFVQNFIKNTARSFVSTLSLINNMTEANMLISALASDSILTRYPNYSIHEDYEYVYDRIDQVYSNGSNCTCQQTPKCFQTAVVYDLNAIEMKFAIPGTLSFIALGR